MSSTTPTQDDGHRLPTVVKPSHYDLTIRTDLKESKFDGIAIIDLDVLKDTSEIVFNVKDLKLGKIALSSDGTVQTPVSTALDATTERVSLQLAQSLKAGSKAQLTVAFDHELTGSMMGYYRSTGGENNEHVYALTQFEPTSAREAFPCWDEPLYKAAYTVTLISRAGTVSLSNMPAVSESLLDLEPLGSKEDPAVSWLSEKLSTMSIGSKDGKWKITRFQKSPPMSTYLVAFANGPFTHLESSYVSPISGKTRPLRIYATPDIIHQAQFALDLKRKVLPLYEQVFDIEYPLPKLDTLVAHDFDASAMENWGLITGRTSALLLDPKSTDIQAMKQVAGTQCHEVAHMWFGDITTMAWWDNLYLNEGFATLMGEIIILDKVYPEWKLNSAFISRYLALAMDPDAKLSSHPIEVECPDANMVNQIFDGLSYFKAASVLRMLSNYVGEERFLKGVSIYLKKHLFANSVTKDLWEGIEAATDLDIPKMMDVWVKKMGFPVVKVTETENGIHVRQDRFLETGPAKPEDNETIWTIPLSLLTVDASGEAIVHRDIVLDEREKTIPIDISKPYKLNVGTVSYYRTLYSPEVLVKIGQVAAQSPSPFTVEDRIGLVFDAMELSKAGYSDVSSALSLVDVLRNEQEQLVWGSIGDNLNLLSSVWYENADIADALRRFRRELFGPIVKRLGYENAEGDGPEVRELRKLAIDQAASAGEPDVVEELKGRFAHYMKTGDDSRIPADLVHAIYGTAVREGGRAEWEAVKGIAQKPKNPSSGTAAMVRMGSTRDPALAEATFEYVMKEARDQDIMYFLGGLSLNPRTRRLLAEAFKENYDTLYKRTEGNFSMQMYVRLAFRELTTEEDYASAVEFFKDKDTSKYDMALQQTLDAVASRASWIKRSTGELQAWFEARV